MEKSEFAEDLEFAVLDVEDYKRILALGTGWPSGVRWEVEGWKVNEVGRYRSGVCADCARAIRPMLRKKRLIMVAVGLGFFLLCPLSISQIDRMPVVGLIGGWFLFPCAGFISLILAYQLYKTSGALDGFHRKAWKSGGGKTLHASYGMLPRQKGVQMRYLLKDWASIRDSYEEERRASGWSHFIVKLQSTLAADSQPTRQQTLEAFGAGHMGEIMDRHPHKSR
jgi:hypothetical protein